MSAVEQSLQRLFDATPQPPDDEIPLDQLLLQAEIIAHERQLILSELAGLIAAGQKLGSREKAMLDMVLQIDARWQARLANARARLEETCERAERPTGRVSGYRGR